MKPILATHIRHAADKAERAALPANHSLTMMKITRRFLTACSWDLVSGDQRRTLGPCLESLSSISSSLRAGDVPEQSPAWARCLGEAARVLGQSPSTLLAGLDPGALRERLERELSQLGTFSPSAQRIEATRSQMSSWGYEARPEDARNLLEREHTSRHDFLADWLKDLGSAA